jgi:hypothetical protein
VGSTIKKVYSRILNTIKEYGHYGTNQLNGLFYINGDRFERIKHINYSHEIHSII